MAWMYLCTAFCITTLSAAIWCCSCVPTSPFHYSTARDDKARAADPHSVSAYVPAVEGAVLQRTVKENIQWKYQRDKCLSDNGFSRNFNELAMELGVYGEGGHVCEVKGGREDGQTTTADDEDSTVVCTSCETVYTLCCGLSSWQHPRSEKSLRKTNPVTEDTNSTLDEHTPPEQAYGYGFAMVFIICFTSLLGLLVVPFLQKNSKLGVWYKYIYALLISLGVASMFCDAILHLIPHAFDLHDHGNDPINTREIIWKGCAVLGGAFVTFVIEVLLHTIAPHSHGHTDHHTDGNTKPKPPNETTPLLHDQQRDTHVTIPRGQDSSLDHRSPTLAVLHPRNEEECPEGTHQCSHSNILYRSDTSFSCSSNHEYIQKGKGKLPPTVDVSQTEHKASCCSLIYTFFRNIKPLAWVIIIGDGLHNLADGIALGAAISQSLGVGISTAIAILCHEVPHELGDFAILLSTGMRWYTALLFSFVSHLAAVVGFFTGVAVGTDSENATEWILAVTAGQFLYISLVDLLPQLLHMEDKGCSRWGQFVMVLIGFTGGFSTLLLIAVYEDQLDSLVE